MLNDFIDKKLPEEIFKSIKMTAGKVPDEDDVNKILMDIWKSNFNNNLDNFSFIYSTRLARSKKTNEFLKLFLLKTPELEDNSENHISSAILTTSSGSIKFFGFKELDSKTVPVSFLNNNQRYLLYEIDKNLQFKNWGTLLNTRNLNEITQSIILAAGIQI